MNSVKIHGITTQKAMEVGLSLDEVIKQFETDFASATYIVGHNVEFDKRIVGAEMIRLGKNDIMDSKKSFCTMKSSINLCKIPGYNGYKYPKLQELYKKLFAKEFEIAHDAMSDIEATKECFWELKKLKLIWETFTDRFKSYEVEQITKQIENGGFTFKRFLAEKSRVS